MAVADEHACRIENGTDAVDGSAVEGALGAADTSWRGSVKSCLPSLFTKKLNEPMVKSISDSIPANVS